MPSAMVPADWSGMAATEPEVVIDLGFSGGAGFQAEALAYRADGHMIKAVSPFNNYLPVTRGEPVEFYLEAAANPDVGNTGFLPTPNGDLATAIDTPLYVIKKLALALKNVEVWELRADIGTLSGLMHELPIDSSRRAEILFALQRAIDATDPDDVAGTAAAARRELTEALSRPASASAHRIVAVGHAHIDSAWLWPVRETIRKCARTFSNVIQLADADPTFKFACSSAQQYAWIKQYYPELFDKITEKVRGGQFVPVGGMWVESDTNMPGGEALARQFVAGKGSSWRTLGSRPRRFGCRIPSVTPQRSPRSSARRARGGSSPRRSPGTRSTPCRTTRSGGRASTAVGCSPTSRRRIPTTPPSQVSR
jgi:alpha-mannosidase